MPSKPSRVMPSVRWKHHEVYENVREAIYSLPAYFQTQTIIEGIAATDIFTLNTALGATIENQVVETLNQMRNVWDPDGTYALYHFIRQSQTFPDVLLTKSSYGGADALRSRSEIILGIELKGWYLLAKEGEPSFRYKVTPDACAVQDMIVVVPWALSNVISGTPRVFTPYLESANYAAAYRNYWWSHIRQAKADATVLSPENVAPYPRKTDQISDEPVDDRGGNFGRYSRTGIMDEYLAGASSQPLCGIRADHWRSFFKLFQDQKDEALIIEQISLMKKRIGQEENALAGKQKAALDLLLSLEHYIIS